MSSNTPRRPGELVFNLVILTISLFLLYSAYGISGFEALSAPGGVPMVTTFLMVVTSGLILRETLLKSAVTGEKLERDILPLSVLAMIALIAAYALFLKPLGFIPTSFLFLLAAIKLLSRRPLGWCALMAALSVVGIYAVFRLIFSVLMPAGIVPEAEILAFFHNLFAGSAK